jgi:hypothetical protein
MSNLYYEGREAMQQGTNGKTFEKGSLLVLYCQNLRVGL